MGQSYQRATVLKNRQLNSQIFELTLGVSSLVTAQPGQFIMLEHKAPQSVLSRPFSIYFFDATAGIIKLAFQVVGPNTQRYAELKAGQTIKVQLPCGQPATVRDSAEVLLLVSGGCGSLYFLAHQYHTAKNIMVCAGFKSQDWVFGLNDLNRLKLVRTYVATDDGSQGTKGTAVDLFQQVLADFGDLAEPGKIQVFSCGPRIMMQQVAVIAKQKQIPCSVVLEEMMACGSGSCKGCAVKTTGGIKLACQDGPTFNAEEVIWDD